MESLGQKQITNNKNATERWHFCYSVWYDVLSSLKRTGCPAAHVQTAGFPERPVPASTSHLIRRYKWMHSRLLQLNNNHTINVLQFNICNLYTPFYPLDNVLS